MKILIVDDHPANLKVARLALQGEGYEVRTSGDAEDALIVIMSWHPDLILMDIQLPGMDGYELTRKLKSDPTTRHIVIIAVTAYAMKGDRQRAVDSGCDGYLSKPVDPISLPATISSFLGHPEEKLASLTQEGPSTLEVYDIPTLSDTDLGTVLVVDDNAATRKLYRVAIEAAGYGVAEAGDGMQALAMLEAHQFNLAIFDLVLPDMGGQELLRHVRSRYGADLPIFCASGIAPDVDHEKTGFSAVLLKPLDPLELVELINLYLAPDIQRHCIGGGIKVLLVDDEPTHRRLGSAWMNSAGFDVLVSSNSSKVIEVALLERPDVIVSDVLMPGLDGFALCRKIRTHPELRDTPVVLLTAAFSTELDQEIASRAGANILLKKGEGLDVLSQAVLEAHSHGAPLLSEDDSGFEVDRSKRIEWQLAKHMEDNRRLKRKSTIQQAQLSVLAGIAARMSDHLGHRSVAAPSHRDAIAAQLLRDSLAVSLDLVGASRGLLFTMKEDDRLEPVHAIGFDSNHNFELSRESLDELSKLILRRQVVGIPSPNTSEHLERELAIVTGAPSVLVVPVAWGGVMHGGVLLSIASALETDLRDFARVLGAQLGMAVELAATMAGLSESEVRFRSLVESLDEWVITHDKHGAVVGCFGGVGRTWPGPADLEGKLFEDIFPNDQAPDFSDVYGLTDGGKSVTFEWASSAVDHQGERRDCAFQTSVVRYMNQWAGDQIGFVSMTRDITNLRELQARLIISDRMASIGMLASGVAHEINNPLAAMVGCIEFISDWIDAMHAKQGHIDPDMLEALEDATTAGRRVRDIVRDLKLFSRGKGTETEEVIDVHEVMTSTIRMVINDLRHRAILEEDFSNEPLYTSVPESRLGQVLLNLVVNAVQALPTGRATENFVRISTRALDERTIEIQVADSGPGIPEDKLKTIFTPFYTTKSSAGGSGLGLALCQNIVSEVGGSLQAENAPEGGAVFTVRIPRVGDEETAEHGFTVEETPQVRGRVLLIDDNPIVARSLQRLLRTQHDVVVELKGKAVLDRLQRGEFFDVIVSDLMMPEMTGIELYEKVTEIDSAMASRIIFMTGGAFGSKEENFLKQLPFHLSKPIDISELRELINLLVATRKLPF